MLGYSGAIQVWGLVRWALGVLQYSDGSVPHPLMLWVSGAH